MHHYRQHTMPLSSFTHKDDISYVRKNKTRNCQLKAAERYEAKLAHICLRLSPALKETFESSCKQHNISVNSQIVSLMRDFIEKGEPKWNTTTETL